MLKAYDEVKEMAKKGGSMHMRAYMVAIHRICIDGKLRGGSISLG